MFFNMSKKKENIDLIIQKITHENDFGGIPLDNLKLLPKYGNNSEIIEQKKKYLMCQIFEKN